MVATQVLFGTILTRAPLEYISWCPSGNIHRHHHYHPFDTPPTFEMADTINPPPANGSIPTPGSAGTKPKSGPPRLNKQQQLNKIYALPAPLRTFPLPTLVPHNPLSLFHLIYVWVSQTLKPETAHFDPVYQGWFSPETRSVHVTDTRSMRGLWEQGFYGKGSLSRSEPSWLSRETSRKGTQGRTTAEERTRQRRVERQQTKWERARKEREAIDLKLQEEAEAALQEKPTPEIEQHVPEQDIEESELEVETTLDSENISQKTMLVVPIGPLELLALPNSAADLEALKAPSVISCTTKHFGCDSIPPIFAPPVGPLQLLALPNKLPISTSSRDHVHFLPINGHIKLRLPTDQSPLDLTSTRKIAGEAEDAESIGGSETNEDTTAEGSIHSEESETSSNTPQKSALAGARPKPPLLLREKSVRFSPMVEKTTFITSDPPNPEHAAEEVPLVELTIPAAEADFLVIKDQEHTQLTLEEAFFLSYGLGSLQILDPETKQQISNKALFTLFRQTSYFPPLTNQPLSPDDPFMLNYVAYHHYRSLGWVPRSGIKFSVDLMLYVRGPVFTHAEYGVIILPSYSDPYWQSTPELRQYAETKEKRTWHWISCINRVITQVKKTLILTYVDVPRPVEGGKEEEMAVNEVLARYKVREVVLKRWVANRSRD